MKEYGYCTKCGKPCRVTVETWHLGIAVGICDKCEEKKEPKKLPPIWKWRRG